MKTKSPSFQFFPADWLNDIKLKACSLSAKGLLIDLMCLMHQSKKYGYLVLNGTKSELKLNENVLKKILNVNKKSLHFALKELLDLGVLKTDENENIFCKRMVQDEYIRNIRREAGSKGGNPILLTGQSNPYYLDKQNDKHLDKQRDNQKGKQKITPSSSSSSSSKEIYKESLIVDYQNHLKKTKPKLQSWYQTTVLVLLKKICSAEDIPCYESCLIIKIENDIIYLFHPDQYRVNRINKEYPILTESVLTDAKEEIKDPEKRKKMPVKVILTSEVNSRATYTTLESQESTNSGKAT